MSEMGNAIVDDFLYHWGAVDGKYELWRGLNSHYGPDFNRSLDTLQELILKERVKLIEDYYDRTCGGLINATIKDSEVFEVPNLGRIMWLLDHHKTHRVGVHLYIHAFLLNVLGMPNPLVKLRDVLDAIA